MATATRGRRRTTKPAAVEVEELEDVEEIDEDTDVEELELDEPEELEEEPAPKRRGRKAAPAKATKAAPAKTTRRKAAPVEDDEDEDTGPTYDSNWLADYVNETCGTDYDARALRMLLRKLAHAGTIQREVGTDRSRYTFPKGANDPIVKAVVRAVKSGEVEEAKSAGIAKAQASKATAKKTTTKAAPAKATRRTRRTRAVEVEDEDEED